MTTRKKSEITGFVNQKGGVGKSTGARNTHVKDIYLGKQSVILDCDDDQHSCYEFNKRREFFKKKDGLDIPSLNVVKMNYSDLKDGILEYAKKFDHLIIDPPGNSSKETKFVMAISTRLVSWLKYGQDEMDTMPKMQELLTQSKNSSIPAFIIPNEISTNYRIKPTELEKLKQCVEKKAPSFKITNSFISFRYAYKTSRETGLAVFELKGAERSRAAIVEFNNYYNEVFHG